METGARLGRMVGEVLSQVCSLSLSATLRDRVAGQAPSSGPGAAWFGVKEDGELAIIFPLDSLVAIGGGAQTTGDGQDMYGFQTTLAVSFPDVEVHELVDPFFILWRRFKVNSGGAGHNRGGMALDQGYMLWNVDNFSGSCFMAAVELPARGISGGYPGGAGRSAVIRSSDVLAQLEAGKSVSSPEKLQGTLDILPAKVSNVPLRQGDVYWAISSGGGGLGDPFHRSPEIVDRDLRDARITRSAAEELYGAVVCESSDGLTVDIDGTWENRDSVRLALVPTKTLRLKDVASAGGFNSVKVGKDHWACAYCDTELASTDDNWKERLAPRRRLLADLFDAVQTQVRRRQHQPVHLAERYCPTCASSLSVDIEVEEAERTPPVFTFATGQLQAAE
jgi:hypothetical protein